MNYAVLIDIVAFFLSLAANFSKAPTFSTQKMISFVMNNENACQM